MRSEAQKRSDRKYQDGDTGEVVFLNESECYKGVLSAVYLRAIKDYKYAVDKKSKGITEWTSYNQKMYAEKEIKDGENLFNGEYGDDMLYLIGVKKNGKSILKEMRSENE